MSALFGKAVYILYCGKTIQTANKHLSHYLCTQTAFTQPKKDYITYGDTGVQNYGDKRVQNCGDSRFILDLRIVVTKFRVQNYGDKQFAVTISIYWCVTTIPQHNNQLQNCGDNINFCHHNSQEHVTTIPCPTPCSFIGTELW